MDFFIVSYPKSGRTWLRFMLINYLQRHFGLEIDPSIIDPTALSKLNSKIPRIMVTHAGGDVLEMYPEDLKNLFSKFKNKNIVLLVRDPRDVLVSSYFHKTKRANIENKTPYKKTISEFIKEERGSLATYLEFHKLWYEMKPLMKKILLIKYENLHKEPVNEMKKILEFFGIKNLDEKQIKDSISFAQFENMRKMEINESIKSKHLKAGKKNDFESYKTRRGEIGAYKDYLNNDEILYINKKVEDVMPNWYEYKNH